MLPGWGRASTFDTEQAPDIVGGVFDDVEVLRWDAPLIHLPDRAAVGLFLRGRGLPDDDVDEAARRLGSPLDVTKRGALIWGRAPTPSDR